LLLTAHYFTSSMLGETGMAPQNYVLGLDLGANSIGWALIDEASEKIIASGVRVFPEGVDNFDTKKEKSKTEDRRIVRGMRRQIARRARRKRWLREALVEVGLLPADRGEQSRLDQLDPYKLRARALAEPLHPHELGRVLIHLNQRRGFLSNRKSDRERKSETKGMLAEINQLAGEMAEADSKSLGEHFAKSLARNPHERIRGHHTQRSMLEAEFDLIWKAQEQHHSELLTDELKHGTARAPAVGRDPLPRRSGVTLLNSFGIHGLIFYQRPMYWPKSVVGACELEPKQKRCPRADRLAQRVRLLQEVNNLRYLDNATGEEHRLSPEQRALLLDKLSKCDEMAFDKLRKELGFLETITFNLEAGKRTKLQGMKTDAVLANKKLFGPKWHARPDAEKTQIVRTLIHGDEATVRRRALGEWNLDEQTIERLLDVDMPAGYGHLSIAAMERLLPHLEKGLLYMTGDGTPSALSEAGYLRPDQKQHAVRDRLPEPPDVTNPVVRQALHELRRVVNSLLGQYDKPTRIHLELARNAAASSEERARMSQRMREREAQRDRAAGKVREHGVKVTREAIDRYLLWEEQGGVCIYSSQPISPVQLLGGEAQIDHILPYSRCLDDSFANKVVCLVRPNADKKNQTPYEWLAARDPERFEKVRQNATKLPYNKRRRFTQKELELDKFIERQLNDTRYISRKALEYLRCLYREPHNVHCPKGNHTETLRWLWGLNTVLREDATNRKNRCDHRHHAIDAIVIALTDHKRLQALSSQRRFGDTERDAQKIEEPWTTFRADVEGAIAAINVSHRVRRRVAGALHEDTLYGPTQEPGVFVVRKPVESLTPAMVEDIRDPTIRGLVIDRLAKFNIKHGRGSKDKISADVWKEPLTMPSGVPIKRVRLVKRDQTIQPIREGGVFVKPGSTHHLCLFQWVENGKMVRDAVFVTMLEAMNRIKRQEQIIQRVHPQRPDAQFLMSLSGGEAVQLEHNGHRSLYTFVTAASTSKQMWFRLHTAGGRSSDKSGVITKMPGSLEGRKVTVTPLGDVRWAND
jgi:CRISPR-associated endonuclease Csn1